MGILALIPVKDWLYGALILALLAGFGWYTVHERDLGAAHLAAEVTKTTQQAEAQRAAELTAQAKVDNDNLQKVQNDYQTQLDASAHDNADLVQRLRDYDARSRSASVPSSPAPVGGTNDAPAEPYGVEDAIAGVILAAGHDAAQVKALQQYITAECH